MELSRSRITAEQRRLMVDFIKLNKCVVTGRFVGPDGARLRAKVLEQMAKTLNSTGSGAVKTPEKWLRSFQDWKSDTKKKAAKIASHARGTGGGPPVAGLSDVERDLVDLIGETSVSGHEEVPDPLEVPSSRDLIHYEDPEPFGDQQPVADPEPSENPACSTPQLVEPIEPPMKERRKRKRDEDFDERMVAAMEQQSQCYAEIAKQIGRLADVGILFYSKWAQLNNVDQNEPLVEYIIPSNADS